jgi:hypothetical protein
LLRAAWLGVAALVPASAAGAQSTPGQPASGASATSSTTVIQINLEPSGALLDPDSPLAFNPADPPPFDIVPPLSVYESRLMLRDARDQLRAGSRETLAARAPRIDFMLESVARYIRWVDRAHTTVPYYTWRPFGDDKVRAETWRDFRFGQEKPVENVTAITLRAHHGDIIVQQVTVTHRDRRQWRFSQLTTLRGDQPGAEVCFLPLPTDVAAIEVRCRRPADAEGRTPRLFAQTGRCSRPESAKQAVYYIQRARSDLRRGQLESIDDSLELAADRLLEYQKDRRL